MEMVTKSVSWNMEIQSEKPIQIHDTVTKELKDCGKKCQIHTNYILG